MLKESILVKWKIWFVRFAASPLVARLNWACTSWGTRESNNMCVVVVSVSQKIDIRKHMLKNQDVIWTCNIICLFEICFSAVFWVLVVFLALVWCPQRFLLMTMSPLLMFYDKILTMPSSRPKLLSTCVISVLSGLSLSQPWEHSHIPRHTQNAWPELSRLLYPSIFAEGSMSAFWS